MKNKIDVSIVIISILLIIIIIQSFIFLPKMIKREKLDEVIGEENIEETSYTGDFTISLNENEFKFDDSIEQTESTSKTVDNFEIKSIYESIEMVPTSDQLYYEEVLEQVRKEYSKYEIPENILLSINKKNNPKYKLELIDGLEYSQIYDKNKESIKNINKKLDSDINEKILEQIIYNELAKMRYLVQYQELIEEKGFESDLLTRLLNYNLYDNGEDKENLLFIMEDMYIIDKEEWTPIVRFWLYNNIVSLDEIQIYPYKEILKNIIDEMLFLRDSQITVISLESDSSLKSMDGKDILLEVLITMDGVLYTAYLTEFDGSLSLLDIR